MQSIREEMIAYLNDPHELERLYRHDKSMFKHTFNAIYPEIKDQAVASYWFERLNFTGNETVPVNGINWITVVAASLLAGFIAKIPAIFHVKEEFFYARNIGFIIFPILTAYFAWKNKLTFRKCTGIFFLMLTGLIYINVLPDQRHSDTLVLACIHLLLFLWSILGFAFCGTVSNRTTERLGFLKYNGDLIVMTTLILITGGLMTGITIGLFSLIGINIERFYFQNVVIVGLAAAPIVATYLVQNNPQLVGKVSPVIARLFSPLVVIMLTVYLVTIIYSGKDPYNDREFLLIFNALLIGVMAIVFFSVAETTKMKSSKAEIVVIFLLSLLTIIVNGVALSAIVFRIAEWGITPNRAAVAGGNLLILINLVNVNLQLTKVLLKKSGIHAVGNTITAYLPVYFLWTIIVTFLFPLLFGFK